MVFYDKIRDLEKAKQSSKRALEKDNAVQLHLLNIFKTRKKLEYLRMEVRLNKRQKIKALFKSLAIKSDLPLKSLFKPAISRKILLYYLDELESKRSPILDYTAANDKTFLAELIFNNPALSTKKIIQIYGLKKGFRNDDYERLRALWAKQNQRDLNRLMREAKEAKLAGFKYKFSSLREQIVKSKFIKAFLISKA